MGLRKVGLPLLPVLLLVQGAFSQTVTRIEITPSSTTMRVGEELTFTAVGKDASDSEVSIPQPQWLLDGVDLHNPNTTCLFTATRTGHFSLTCRDAASGTEKTAGISVAPARGDTSEVFETSASPPPLTGHTMTLVNGVLYLFGGETEGGSLQSGKQAKPTGTVMNSLWRLNEEQARWEQEQTSNPPPPRADHSAIGYNGKMYVFCGRGADGNFLNDVWEYDPVTQSYVQRTVNPPLEAVSGARVDWEGKWTFWGGTKKVNGDEVPNEDVVEINANSLESSHVTQFPLAGIPLGSTYDPDEGWLDLMVSDDYSRVSTFHKNSGQWTDQYILGSRPPSDQENVRVTKFGNRYHIRGTWNEGGALKGESWTLNIPSSSSDPYFTRNSESEIEGYGDSGTAETVYPPPLAKRAASSLWRILFFGGRKLDGSLSDATIIYTPPYEDALASIALSPEEVQMNVGETIRFVAKGYDAEDFATSLEPLWSSTGGTIDTLGFFTATEAGDFTVTAANAEGTITGTATGVEDETGIPTEFALDQNYPNPFNPTTTIRFAVKEKCRVVLKVFDVLGREVETLVDSRYQRGAYKVMLDAQNLSSGVYFYRIQMKNFVGTKKMVLLE